MLRLVVSPEEYLMINDNIKIIFLGGSKNNIRIMVDAPKEVNIVRSTVLEANITNPEERAKLPKYYREPDKEQYMKKPGKKQGNKPETGNAPETERAPEVKQKFRKSKVIITRGNADSR